MKKIVILITKAGGGHLALAKALEQSLLSKGDNKYSITIYDPTPESFAKFYQSITSWPFSGVWSILWKITNNKVGIYIISTINFIIFGKKLIKDLRKLSPDIVISNSPMTIKELSTAKKKIKKNFLTCVHVADPFSAHSIWFSNKEIDLFLVPTENTKQMAIKENIPNEKIKKVGWLTKKQFLNYISVNNIREVHNIGNDDFLIFLGASSGQKHLFYKFINNFIKSGLHKSCKLIINTGLNPSYLSEITKLVKSYRDSIYIIPYTQRMELYLGASDLVVSKAGPNFLFENIHLQKPFLALGCIPGQEEGNLDFITSAKIGWYLDNPKDYIKLIKDIIKDRSILKMFSENMLIIAKDNRKTSKNIEKELSLILKDEI